MEEIIKNDVCEDIDLDVKSKTIHFPVRVTLRYEEDDSFITSVDEHGHIIVTPRSETSEFISAHTEWESDDYIMPTEDEIISEDLKSFTLNITADLLMEVESERIFGDIDSIGQCVIYPQEGNSFISASIDDSLNLTTEDLEKSTPDSEEDATAENEPDDDPKPEVEGSIVEEVIDAEYSKDEVEKELQRITFNFTDTSGCVKCGYESEKDAGVEILSKYYNSVTVKQTDLWFHICYCDKKDLNEEASIETDIVSRFMRGELPIFSDDVVPANCEHITELDSEGFTYYYDPESDSIVVVSPQRGV